MVPREIFLRHKSGDAIGPLPIRSLEVLYYARVIDDGTPISDDGARFRALSEAPDLARHVQNVKQMLLNGQDPWPETTEDVASVPIVGRVDFKELSPLKAMFTCALAKSTGKLSFAHDGGDVVLSYSDGKVVEVIATDPALSLEKLLLDTNAVTAAALQQANKRVAAMGGLGGALISLGLIQPNVFIEKFVDWGKRTIGAVLGWEHGSSGFEVAAVAAPPLPLGLDRYGILIEALRLGLPREVFERILSEKKGLLVIPSSVEGVSVEDLKLDPRELRVIKAVDGVRTLAEMLEAQKGRGEQAVAAMRATYFASELGLIVFGEDPLVPKEREEAQKIREVYEKLKPKNFFEVLGVAVEADDDTVRGKYKEYAKRYHPDMVRSAAAPELLEARRKVFDLISTAYEALETADRRKSYQLIVQQGFSSHKDEQAIVQAILQAEAMFRKAEALSKSRKYEEALVALEEAIKNKPKDVEFKIHRSYYKFLIRKETREEGAAIAIKEIQELLKSDGNIAAGYLFLGRLNKVLDKSEAAIKYFKKVLEYDATNTEAQSEIRLVNLRQDKAKKKWL